MSEACDVTIKGKNKLEKSTRHKLDDLVEFSFKFTNSKICTFTWLGLPKLRNFKCQFCNNISCLLIIYFILATLSQLFSQGYNLYKLLRILYCEKQALIRYSVRKEVIDIILFATCFNRISTSEYIKPHHHQLTEKNKKIPYHQEHTLWHSMEFRG